MTDVLMPGGAWCVGLPQLLDNLESNNAWTFIILLLLAMLILLLMYFVSIFYFVDCDRGEETEKEKKSQQTRVVQQI